MMLQSGKGLSDPILQVGIIAVVGMRSNSDTASLCALTCIEIGAEVLAALTFELVKL